MLTRWLRSSLVIIAVAAMMLASGCDPDSPVPSTSATSTPTVSAPSSPSATPTPTPSATETETETETETPEPITPPESEYTDTALASMVAAVSVDGQQPQVWDAQQVRWNIASVKVSPDECAVLLTGLASAAARGLPVTMATIGPEADQYQIVVVGADDATREQVVTDRGLASKRCSKLSTSYGDPAGPNSETTEWVVRQGTPKVDLDDIVEVDLTSDSAGQRRVIAGRLGNVMIQVSSTSVEAGGGEQLEDVVAAVASRIRASQGSASPSATPSPTPTPPDDSTPSP